MAIFSKRVLFWSALFRLSTVFVLTPKNSTKHTHFPLKNISSKQMPILSTVIKFRVKCVVFILEHAFYLEVIKLDFWFLEDVSGPAYNLNPYA